MTITELLDTKTTAVRKYRQKKTERDNCTQQRDADEKFRRTACSARELGDAVRTAKESLGFCPSERTNEALTALADALDNVIQEGLADRTAVTAAGQKYTAAFSLVKKDWDGSYSEIVRPTEGTLRAIEAIARERARPLLDGIRDAQAWQGKESQVKALIDCIDATQELVGKLGLNRAVENFLRKASSGDAALDDLTDEVMLWLRKTSLEGNVRLSLASHSNPIPRRNG